MNIYDLINKTAKYTTKGKDMAVKSASTLRHEMPKKVSRLKREAKFAWMEGVQNARK